MSDRRVYLTLGAVVLWAAGCGGGSGAAARVPDGGPGTGGSEPGAGDAGVVDVGVGPWTSLPDAGPGAPLDDVTVYAFSQTYDGTPDPQVITLAPDMNIRAWQRWDTSGVTNDFDVGYVNDCHAAGTRFIGGTTATALFQDEFPNTQFPSLSVDDVDTRNGSGAPVVHSQIPNMHRGSLANPDYRAYLVQICEIQIDDGVDGLFFDEINADYQGANYDANEGFDAAHLADFNAYLLWRFPGADYQTTFKMTSDNLLKPDVPAGDLTHNFRGQGI